MNIQPHAMPCPVKIPLHASVHQTGLIAGLFEPSTDALMDFHPVSAVFNFRDGFFLRIFHRAIQPFELKAHRPPYHRAGHVCKIATRGGTRKHIEDNTAVRGQRPAPFIVGITGLLPSRHDRMLGDTVPFHEFHIDELLDPLRGHRLTIQPQLRSLDFSLP